MSGEIKRALQLVQLATAIARLRRKAAPGTLTANQIAASLARQAEPKPAAEMPYPLKGRPRPRTP